MVLKKYTLLIVFYSLGVIYAQENLCIINGKKSLNTVSKEFLSISIDPALILSPHTTFKNASANDSLKLARYLAPGFLRISGQSTEFLRYNKEEEDSKSNSLTIKPSKWKSINLWIKRSHLTPIFAVNDKFSGHADTIWDPNTITPLLNINNEFDFSCYWQLGFDCKYKTLVQYKEDLQTFRNFLDTFPTRQLYKIVGSNLHSCLAHRSPELIQKYLEDLEYTADAVIWESQNIKTTPFIAKTYMPIYLTLPKDSQTVSFTSSLLWAKHIGDAAKAGYKVIFRQPRIHELHSETPIFWISLLHKALMGQTVLDVTTSNQHQQNSYVYAHCAKKQLPQPGAVTILIVNTGADQYTSFLRLASSSQPKTIEIETYILTSEDSNSRNIYLNGAKLTTEDLQTYPFKPTPKIRRVKVDNLLSLSVPAKSIGFFVLLAAKTKVCIDNANQNIFLAKEMPLRLSQENTPINLKELYETINKEIQEDEKFYEKNKTVDIPDEIIKPNKFKISNRIFKESKLKRPYKNKIKFPVSPPKLEIIFTERPWSIDNDKKKVELQLTKSEIKKILTDRAKSVISRNDVQVTSSEVQNLMTDSTKPLKNRQKRNKLLRIQSPLKWVKNFRNKTKSAMLNRIKRDINMDLLRYRDQHHPQSRSRYFLNKKYFPSTADDFDPFPRSPYEEDFNSDEFDINYYEESRKKHKYDYHEDERIRFLSEADKLIYSRIPRSNKGDHNIPKKTLITQRFKQKIPKIPNKSNVKAAREKLISNLKEHKRNNIEKLKRQKQAFKQKDRKNKMDENIRKKRTCDDQFIPKIPIINSIQKYTQEKYFESKPWRQENLLKIKKLAPYSTEYIDSMDIFQIPVSKKWTLNKRSIENEIIKENSIEYPLNSIYKGIEFYTTNNDDFSNYSTTVLPITKLRSTSKTITSTQVLLPNNFINIESDTKNNETGNIQQTKVQINEEGIANIILNVTTTILQSIAEKFSNIFF